jgi:hypothetical protein
VAGSTESISRRVSFYALGWESTVSTEDVVDDVLRILEVLSAPTCHLLRHPPCPFAFPLDGGVVR